MANTDLQIEFFNLLNECSNRIPLKTIAAALDCSITTIYGWKCKKMERLPRNKICIRRIHQIKKLMESYDPSQDPNNKRSRYGSVKRTVVKAIDVSKLSNPGMYQVDGQGLVTKVEMDNPFMLTLNYLNDRRNKIVDRLKWIDDRQMELDVEEGILLQQKENLDKTVEVLREFYQKEVGK